jgi:hypothetical protein
MDNPKLYLNLDKTFFGLVGLDQLSTRCRRAVHEGLMDGPWAPMSKSDTHLSSHFYHWIQTRTVRGGVMYSPWKLCFERFEHNG